MPPFDFKVTTVQTPRQLLTQELLGHSDPSTTAGYIAYSHVDAAAAVGSLWI